MKVRLVFVPPGGGEADYSLDFELPSLPQPGDYISIMRPDQQGTEDFIVRRTGWTLDYPSNDVIAKQDTEGKVASIAVECEFALGYYSSEAHKKACGRYGRQSGQLKQFEASAY